MKFVSELLTAGPSFPGGPEFPGLPGRPCGIISQSLGCQLLDLTLKNANTLHVDPYEHFTLGLSHPENSHVSHSAIFLWRSSCDKKTHPSTSRTRLTITASISRDSTNSSCTGGTTGTRHTLRNVTKIKSKVSVCNFFSSFSFCGVAVVSLENLQLGHLFRQHQAYRGCQRHPNGPTQVLVGESQEVGLFVRNTGTHSGSTETSGSASTRLTTGSSLSLLSLRSRRSGRSSVTLRKAVGESKITFRPS